MRKYECMRCKKVWAQDQLKDKDNPKSRFKDRVCPSCECKKFYVVTKQPAPPTSETDHHKINA